MFVKTLKGVYFDITKREMKKKKEGKQTSFMFPSSTTLIKRELISSVMHT